MLLNEAPWRHFNPLRVVGDAGPLGGTSDQSASVDGGVGQYCLKLLCMQRFEGSSVEYMKELANKIEDCLQMKR